MPVQVDPNAFANAYGAQQDRSLRNRLADFQIGQQGFANDLALRDQGLQEQAVKQQRDQLARTNDQADEDRQRTLITTQIAPFMQRALQQPNPRQAFTVAMSDPVVSGIFAQAGLNPAEFDPNDPDLEHEMQALAALAPSPATWKDVQGPRGTLLQQNSATGEKRQVVGQMPTQASDHTPSGYRQNGAGGLEPIPGGPADPNTPTKDNSRIFAKADKLRDEFNAQSKDFIALNDSFNTLKELSRAPSAAGDISMIFSYMKMLDPGSVVRENEYATAQNAAGIPDRVRNTFNRLQNGERLNEDQRKDFIQQAENLYRVKKGRQDAITKRYTDIATRNKVNPDDVVGDLAVAIAPGDVPRISPQQAVSDPRNYQQSSQAPRLTPEQAAKLPSGTQFIGIDGKQRIKH